MAFYIRSYWFSLYKLGDGCRLNRQASQVSESTIDHLLACKGGQAGFRMSWGRFLLQT